MTRKAGLHNVEYAQADILKLGTLGRSFDRIEAMGVLHHLADPKGRLDSADLVIANQRKDACRPVQ